MSDLQRDLRAYIDHLAGLAEDDPRARTAPIPRQHPRPPRRQPTRLLVAAAAALVVAAVGWIALDGDDGAKKISTPAATRAPAPTSPPTTAIPLPPADELWNSIAECETGGNWDATGQTYQGGLGIYFKNWEHYGGFEFAPTARQATREQQIVVAERIRAEHGLGAWGCGKTLGYAKSEPQKYVDKVNGFSVEIPVGWEQDSTIHGLVLLQTVEMGTTCDGTAARNAAFISVNEIRPAGSPESAPIAGKRPDTFGPTSGSFDSADQRPDAPGTCTEGVDLAPTQSIVFMDHGRKIQITMRFYPDATVTRRAQAYEILNSMRFKPERKLQRGDRG